MLEKATHIFQVSRKGWLQRACEVAMLCRTVHLSILLVSSLVLAILSRDLNFRGSTDWDTPVIAQKDSQWQVGMKLLSHIPIISLLPMSSLLYKFINWGSILVEPCGCIPAGESSMWVLMPFSWGLYVNISLFHRYILSRVGDHVVLRCLPDARY